MRNLTKKKLMLLLIGFIFGCSILIPSNLIRYQERANDNYKPELKRAGFWEIGPIEIDDSDPSKNWLITAATYEWCRGSGAINDPFIIENVTINGQNSGSCIWIKHSNSYFIIRNCTLYNSGNNPPPRDSGIKLEYTNNGALTNNTCSNNNGYGITLEDSSNNIVSKNIVNDNGRGGICLACDFINTNNNTIFRNRISYNSEEGIFCDGYKNEHILDVNYNNISGNIVSFNSKEGVYLYFSDYTTISNNSVYNNTDSGLYIKNGDLSTIKNNIFYNNTEEAILLIGADNCVIKSNNLSTNGYGIWIYGNNDGNVVRSNIITDNRLYGIVLGDNNVNDNIIFNNNFINNAIHALDSGTNSWDYQSLGNYWDDYGGIDANDDGIGDTPYDVPPAGGSVDNYPIWDDGDDLSPDIAINSPSMNDAFGVNAPNFEITIKDESPINTTWYTIDDGITNYTFSGLTGTVNQTAWDNKGTESMTLRFFANDSLGHIGFEDITIWKDIVAPQITINLPAPYQLCGVNAPTFSLTIIEPNIQEKKYSLNGNPNVTFTTETQFSQTVWDLYTGNGTALIVFYVIDKAGNVNSSQIIVRKDAFIPDITIHSPEQDEIFGSAPPEFNISVIEEDIVSMWYVVEGNLTQHSLTGVTGTISQEVWDHAIEGDVTITFYAQDRAGNVGTESVVVRKRIPSQPLIPGYNLLFLLGVLSAIVIIIESKLRKIRS